MFKIVEVKESIYEDNNKRADEFRNQLKERNVFLLNVMSSPGSGKTTTIVRTIEVLRGVWRIGVMEADIDSEIDAKTIAKTGTKVIQLHTGGMCHLDADMTKQGLYELGPEDLDIVILENIGNLVCPAEFDTGAIKNAMILSVPEGDDKPIKYPLMFSVVDVVLVNKMDASSFFDFNLDLLTKRIKRRNPKAIVIPICAKTGDGIAEWSEWLSSSVHSWRSECSQGA